MHVGFVVSEANWSVMRPSLPDGLFAIAWATASVDEAIAFITASPIDLVVAEATPELLTQALVATTDRLGGALAAVITAPTGIDVADSRGVGHRLEQPTDLLSLVATLSGSPDVPAPPSAKNLPEAGGLLRVLWGSHGAPGVTTLCLVQASVLAREGMRVCVVDADARGGVIAESVGLLGEVPGFLAAIRLAQRDQLDGDQIRRVSTQYSVPPVDWSLLSNPPRPLVRGEVPKDAIDEVLGMLRRVFDVVLVDAGCELNQPRHQDPPSVAAELASHVISLADEVIAVCHASPTGVARFSRVLPTLTSHARAVPVRVWLNGVDSSRRALGDEALFREALWRYADVSDLAIIPRDDLTAREASRRALSMTDVSPQSAVVKAVLAESRGLVISRNTPHPGIASTPRLPASTHARTPWGSGVWSGLRERWLRLTALR